MPFSDTIRTIPFSPRTPLGGGFLPPILRAQGHVLYLLGCLADEQTTVGDADAIAELTQAKEHFDARVDASAAVSTATLGLASTISTALGEARDEYTGWAPDIRLQNLRDLANRVVAFSAALDRELVGLTGSDPGSTL